MHTVILHLSGLLHSHYGEYCVHMYTHKMSTVVLFSHFQAVCLHDKYVGSSCSDSRIEVCCYGIGLALWLITTALAASLSAQTRWPGPVPWYAEQFTVDQQDIPQLLLMAMDTIPWVIHCEMWDARNTNIIVIVVQQRHYLPNKLQH
jgi:hypothetical protein